MELASLLSWPMILPSIVVALLALVGVGMAYVLPTGGVLSQDELSSLLTNPLDAAHQIGASGAVDPTTPGRYVITKAGVAALTLVAPVAGRDDGLELYLGSTTAFAHTVTATGGNFQSGAAGVTTATFPAQAGAGLYLMAFNGKWIVTGIIGAVVFT